jgi:hypothetical protein
MERLVVFAYLVLACLTLAHAVYYNYSSYYLELHSQHPGAQLATYYQQHNSTAIDREHPLFTGTDHAPNQYRIAIPYLAQAIGSLTHSSKYYILYAIFDFLCALAASCILYGLLRRSPFLQSLGPTEQLVAVAFLLVSIAYPFAWVTSFERPETLPTALYLALMSLILSRARPLPMLALASLLTIWQGFVRSDVPVVFAAAVLLLCGTAACRQLFGSRSQAAVFGAVNLTLALSVQFVLQHYLFPYATYPADTKLVQLMSNLHPRPLATFSIAILPYGFIVLGAIAYWKRLDALDQLLVLSSLAYLPLWFAVGADTEVRIFVPYLLALTPTAAKLLFLCVNAKGNRLDRR